MKSLQNSNSKININNFDLLRFLFAGTVCLVHTCELSGYKELYILKTFLSSGVAVKSFFVLSGFLIFMSYERSESKKSYIKKRVRRIYPAYFTSIVMFAVFLALLSTNTAEKYFSTDWIKYVFANLTFLNFLQHTLPGVFETNKLPVVNGALWTLKIEVMFYMTVPFFVFLFRKFGHLKTIMFFYCISVTYSISCSYMMERTGFDLYSILGRQLPGQLSYFLGGGFFYYNLHFFKKYNHYFFLVATLFLILHVFHPLPYLEPFALASLVVFLGFFYYMGKFGKYGDFSYGIYITHFPIIQIILELGWFKDSPWLYLTTVVMFTLISAVIMWHFVEKRFLSKDSHYIRSKN